VHVRFTQYGERNALMIAMCKRNKTLVRHLVHAGVDLERADIVSYVLQVRPNIVVSLMYVAMSI
jgi:Ethanolamine utilization protein EutJ (predicted chaperonin)